MMPAVTDYNHEPLNQEIAAIGGTYLLIKEVRLPFENREILYHIGYAMVDRSCCGTVGCGYGVVQGYIRKWHYKSNPDGLPVSQIERIENIAEENRIRALILLKERVNQVNFL